MNTAVQESAELPLTGESEPTNRSGRGRRKAAEKPEVRAIEAEVMPPEREPGTAIAVVTPTPMQMLQTAIEKGTDLEQMQQLMDLQARWEKTEAIKAYVAAMAAFKADPPTIIKNKKVSFDTQGGDKTEYKHATLDQVAGLIGAAMSPHGLSFAWHTQQAEGGLITVTCTVTHVKGHSDSVSLRAGPDGSGKKNNIQQIASTVTYLERYTLLAITGLAAKDQDNDGWGGGQLDENISAEQKDELVEMMKETKTNTVKYLALLGVPTLDELPAGRFKEAKQVLETRKKEQARR